MKRERICLLVDSNFFPDQEGPSNIHTLLSKMLVQSGYEVYVINFIKNHTIINFLKYQIFRITSGLHILNNEYDIIITPLWIFQSPSRFIIRYFSKKPYILMVHGSDYFQTIYPELVKKGSVYRLVAQFFKITIKMIIDGSSGVISTEEIFNYLISYGIDKRKFHLLNFIYSFDSKKIMEINPAWKKDDKFHILFYGRFHESKGFLNLINAIPKIIRHNDKVIFHLVGDGPQNYSARKMIFDNNLSEYVSFHGVIAHENIYSYIKASDCIVNPVTYGAGPGTVALEVLSQKKPLILGNANITIEKLYRKYKCFLLIQPNDVEDIVNKILMIMDDPKVSFALINNIDNFLLEELDNEKISNKIIQFIEESKIYKKLK
jgi:glycosyltransferase involved in cell wall biosynthesis